MAINRVKKYEEQQTHRPALGEQQLHGMLAILIRNRAAHAAVRDLLTVAHVRVISDGHGTLWQLVMEHYKEHETLPTKTALRTALHAFCDANPNYYDTEVLGGLDEFLAFAFDNDEKDKPNSKANRRSALKTCKLFLEERATAELRQVMALDTQVPFDIPDILRKTEEAVEVANTLIDSASEALFPMGWDLQDRLKYFTTGHKALNEFLGGGHVGGEVYLFLGPYGSCKTLTAIQGAVAGAQEAERRDKLGEAPKGKTPVSVFVTAEPSKREVRERVLATMAKVPRRRIATMESLESLSGSTTPNGDGNPETEYELHRFSGNVKNGTEIICEYERVKAAIEVCNKYLFLVDLTSGNKERKLAGAGGVPEIARIVQAEMRRAPIVPISMWIDHASALATRMIDSGSAEVDQLRHVLRMMPKLAKDYIAEPYNIPVWLMHQLSGEANIKGPTLPRHHSQAAETKAMGEYPDFCICTGPTTHDKWTLCRWDCTKHRREPPRQFVIMKVQGRYNRVYKADKKWKIEGNQFVREDDTQSATAEKQASKHHPASLPEVGVVGPGMT